MSLGSTSLTEPKESPESSYLILELSALTYSAIANPVSGSYIEGSKSTSRKGINLIFFWILKPPELLIFILNTYPESG